MEIIRIVDLMVKIANGEEVPMFKYEGHRYKYNKENHWFEDLDRSDYVKDIFVITELNKEVEIIEDTPKTLEDILTPYELKCFEDVKELVTRLSDEDVKIMVKLLLGDEYDELIEKIRGEENDKN